MKKPGLIDTNGNWQGYMGDLKRSWVVPDSGSTAMLLAGAFAGLGAMRRYLKR